MRKMISIASFLTDDEITRAKKLFKNSFVGEFARRCDEEIITPVLPRINETLGQENNARYLAYMVEYTFHAIVDKEGGSYDDL